MTSKNEKIVNKISLFPMVVQLESGVCLILTRSCCCPCLSISAGNASLAAVAPENSERVFLHPIFTGP